MKRLLLLISICISSVSFGQYTSIPDPNFEQALIDLGHDDVIDGQVLTSNVSGVTYLNVSNKNISDLSGIDDFVGLTSFFCDNNQLTYLNVSPLLNMQYLTCNNNAIDSLILTNGLLVPILYELQCKNNNLTTLNLNNLSSLNDLECDNNMITSLDLSTNTNINDVSATYNNLINIDLSNCSNLEILRLDFNDFSNIDVSNCTNLLWLIMNDNINLINLDVSFNFQLSRLEIPYTSINYISLSNNINLENLDFSGCPIYDLNLSENINLQALDVGGMLLLECLNLKNGNNINNNLDLSGGNNPNLNCITVDNISYAQTNWANWMDNGVSFSENCGNDCSSASNLTELNSNQSKELIKIVNLLGQEVEYTPNTVLIYQYSDGTSEKVFTIED